jgi:hypothetical protein
MSKQKGQRQMKRQSKFNSFYMFYKDFLSILIFIFLNLSCQRNSDFPLRQHFLNLKEYSPKNVIKQFQTTPLDSAVINYDKFPEIFSDAASIVFRDSAQVVLFENYFKENGIDLEYKQDLYTIVAAFHKWLNNEKINIKKLHQEMIEMSNEFNEKRYGKPN